MIPQQTSQTNPYFELDACLNELVAYQSLSRLRQDVAGLQQYCQTLRPKVGSFLAPDGNQVRLFYLGGVIGITYKGASYNIPVNIYLDPPYPAAVPRAFVTPTEGMRIKSKHPHVNATGSVIKLGYLENWNQFSSSLVQLVTHLQSVFSHSPPVYACHVGPVTSGASSGALTSTSFGGTLGLVNSSSVDKNNPSVGGLQPGLGGFHSSHNSYTSGQSATSRKSRGSERKQSSGSRSGRDGEKLRDEVCSKGEQELLAILQPLMASVQEQLELSDTLNDQLEQVQASRMRMKNEEITQNRLIEELMNEKLKAQKTLDHGAENSDYDVDAFLEPADSLHRQLLDLIAEENALEDFSQDLEDSLSNKILSLDEYLLEYRETVKKQFYCRNLQKKVILNVRARKAGGRIINGV